MKNLIIVRRRGWIRFNGYFFRSQELNVGNSAGIGLPGTGASARSPAWGTKTAAVEVVEDAAHSDPNDIIRDDVFDDAARLGEDENLVNDPVYLSMGELLGGSQLHKKRRRAVWRSRWLQS